MDWSNWLTLSLIVVGAILTLSAVWPLVKKLFGTVWPAWVIKTGDTVSVYADEITALGALGPVALLVAKHGGKGKQALAQLKADITSWDDAPPSP